MSNVPDAVLALLEQIHGEQQALNKKVSGLTTKLEAHITEEESMIGRHSAEIIAMQSAFPNGDIHGHQMYHASIIKRNEFLADMFKEAAKHIAKYGLLAFLCWLLWHGFEDIVKNALPSMKGPK